MRKVLTIVLAVISGIGGHFVNRRWDRAVLFFSLFFFWVIGVYIGFSLLVSTGILGNPENAFALYAENGPMYIGIGTLIIWVISLIYTILDSYSIRYQFHAPWTLSGLIGSVFMSLIACLMLTVVTLNNIDLRSKNYDSPRKIEYKKSDSSSFSHRVLFGGYDWRKKRYSDLPNGDAYMTGRFVVGEKSASGIKFRLWFNGEYQTDILITDDEGKFSVSLPEGLWHLNRLETYRWENKPTGEPFLIVSDQEDKLKGNKYSGHGWIQKKGFSFDATKDINDMVITLNINREIILLWPPGGSKKVSATVKDSIIKWNTYEGAADYLVKVHEIKKEGTTTSYHSISARRVTNASELALSEFKTLDGDSEGKEYLIEIYAFASDGTFLSKTGQRYYEGPSFTLTDGKEIIEDIYFADSIEDFSAEELKEISDNDYRFMGVQVLIKEGMFDEAEKLLEKVKGRTKKGKRELVAGYLAAMKGDCTESEKLFSLAKDMHPEICIPAFYRENCD